MTPTQCWLFSPKLCWSGSPSLEKNGAGVAFSQHLTSAQHHTLDESLCWPLLSQAAFYSRIHLSPERQMLLFLFHWDHRSFPIQPSLAFHDPTAPLPQSIFRFVSVESESISRVSLHVCRSKLVCLSAWDGFRGVLFSLSSPVLFSQLNPQVLPEQFSVGFVSRNIWLIWRCKVEPR